MENPNEDQDQMATSSTLMGSSGRPVPVEDIHVEFSELSNAATASGSNKGASDQASNVLADDVIAPLAPSVIGDINCEFDTEIRQPPVGSQHQPSTSEDLTPNLRAPDIEKTSHFYCGICAEKVYVNKCCEGTAHKDCLYESGLSFTNCSCFERQRTVNQSDFPAASMSSSKKPSMNDDVSDTWQNLPLQTFLHHSKLLENRTRVIKSTRDLLVQVFSLVCVICKREEVFMKSPCCESHYHPHCLNQYTERGNATCIYCRRLMQLSPQMSYQLRTLWGGRGNGRGGDDGVRVDDDTVGENNNEGGSDTQGGGDGRGNDNMEGDEGGCGGGGDDDGGGGVNDGSGGVDDGGGGVDDGVSEDNDDEGGGVDDGGGGVDDGGSGVDDGVGGDDDGGGGSGRGSPLPPPPPLSLRLLLPPLHPLPLPPLPPSADNRDEDENSEGGVDEGRNENSDHEGDEHPWRAWY